MCRNYVQSLKTGGRPNITELAQILLDYRQIASSARQTHTTSLVTFKHTCHRLDLMFNRPRQLQIKLLHDNPSVLGACYNIWLITTSLRMPINMLVH